MLEFNVSARFPAAPLLTVILALVGKYSIILISKYLSIQMQDNCLNSFKLIDSMSGIRVDYFESRDHLSQVWYEKKIVTLRSLYSLVASLFLFIDTQAIAVALLQSDKGVLFVLGDNFCEIDDDTNDFCLDYLMIGVGKAKIINWRQSFLLHFFVPCSIVVALIVWNRYANYT